MSMDMYAIKMISEYVFDAPLRTISSENANLVEKAVSGIAIGALSILSCGYYAVHAHDYFEKRQERKDREALFNFVQWQNTQGVDTLLTEKPKLKQILNGEDGTTPSLLHAAVTKGNIQMAELLMTHGADINAEGRLGTPLATVILSTEYETDEIEDKLRLINWLVDNGANPNEGSFRTPLIAVALRANEMSDLDKLQIIDCLLQKGADPNSRFGNSSLLAELLTNLWDSYPEHAKNTVKLMLQKGAQLKSDGKYDIQLSQEKLQFISENTPSGRVSSPARPGRPPSIQHESAC